MKCATRSTAAPTTTAVEQARQRTSKRATNATTARNEIQIEGEVAVEVDVVSIVCPVVARSIVVVVAVGVAARTHTCVRKSYN